MNPTSRHFEVLFVDDDPKFLDMMSKVMGAFSQGRWKIRTAEGASRALGLIQERLPNLVVIDVQMPVVDGLQFLTLINRRYPDLLKVVLTGLATEAYRAACLSNGAELFLEKPKTREGLQELFRTLHELLELQPETSFRGVLRPATLRDVLQMECLGMGSSVLEVESALGSGRIWVREGALVHASADEREGLNALAFLLTLGGADFRALPFAPPPRVTLEGPWEVLMLEAARLRPGGATTLEAASETTRRRQLGLSTGEGGTGLGGDVFAAGPDPSRRRVIEQLLICSSLGEILYQWPLRNPDLWVSLFEFLSQKAGRLAMGLPVGAFNRVEIWSGGSRHVAVIGEYSGVMVRHRAERTASENSA